MGEKARAPHFFFKLLLSRLVFWAFVARGFVLRSTPKIPAARVKKTSGTVPRVVTKVLLLIVSFSHVSQSFLAKSVFCLYVLTVTKNSTDLGEKADCSHCKPGLEAVYFLAARFIKASSHATSHEPGWPGWPDYRAEFRLGFIWEISARSPRLEKAKDPGIEFWRQIRETKQTWRETKVITFALMKVSATLGAVSLQLPYLCDQTTPSIKRDRWKQNYQ